MGPVGSGDWATRGWLRVVVVVVAGGCLLVSGGLVWSAAPGRSPSRGAAAPPSVSQPPLVPSGAVTPLVGSDVRAGCPGVSLPAGYGLAGGIPHPDHAPYAPVTLFNPQSVANFVISATRDTGNSKAGRRCLAELGGLALLKHSKTRALTGGGSPAAVARLFPYAFAFSANPATPLLPPGWVSSIAQGSALSAFMSLYSVTQDSAWLSAGHQVLESFNVAQEDGGFVTQEGGVTWFQEYPTTPYSYVLNGHLAAVIALYQWAALTHDVDATRLADAGLSGARTLLPKFEVELPQGLLTSYDLLRGRTAVAAMRLATDSTGPAAVTAVVKGSPGPAVPVPVTRLSYLSEDLAQQSVDQDLPAARLVPGARYRLTFRARARTAPGTAGTSGGVQVVATCPSGAVILVSHATIRTHDWAAYDVGITLPLGGCGLRVHFALADPKSGGTTLDVSDVAIFQTVPPAPGVGVVTIPVSVLDKPNANLTVSYTGGGRLEAWSEGRWVTLAILPASATRHTVTVPLPAWAQGRTLNWNYHELQTQQVAWISRNPGAGDPFWADHGRRWQELAPTDGAELFG